MNRRCVFDDDLALSRDACARAVACIDERRAPLICLAAGTTPALTYELLADYGRSNPERVADGRFIQLDEWGGLPASDPAACRFQLMRQLITPLNLSHRFISFDGQSPEPEAECSRVASWLAKNGPIDMCVLGLGVNGHVGFNEPASDLEAHAHVAALSPVSLMHSMIAKTARKPSHGLTLGMADILQSREVLVLVSGARKREPLTRLLTGGISTSFPASLLQLHANATILCDADAASPRGRRP